MDATGYEFEGIVEDAVSAYLADNGVDVVAYGDYDEQPTGSVVISVAIDGPEPQSLVRYGASSDWSTYGFGLRISKSGNVTTAADLRTFIGLIRYYMRPSSLASIRDELPSGYTIPFLIPGSSGITADDSGIAEASVSFSGRIFVDRDTLFAAP